MRGRLPKFDGSRNVPSERDSRETISDDLPLHREVEERGGEEAASNNLPPSSLWLCRRSLTIAANTDSTARVIEALRTMRFFQF